MKKIKQKNALPVIEKNNLKNIKIPKINISNELNEKKNIKQNNYNNNIIRYITNPNKKNIINKQEIEEKKDDNSNKKAEILQNLNKIFLNNSKYNSQEKDYFMSRYQIIEILKKSKIIAKGVVSKIQADIILTRMSPQKNKYNLIDFINFLTELCHFMYKDDFENDPKETMDYFLNCLFNNLSYYIEEKNSKNFLEKSNDNSCTIKCIGMIISSKLQKPICKLFLSLYDSFVKIYKVYFQNELTKNVIIDKELMILTSSENLLHFSKDFEICPYIINKTNLNTYFNLLIKYQIENPEIINSIMNNYGKKYKDMGIIFKLSSLIIFIYHFSIFLYYKDFKSQDLEDLDFEDEDSNYINKFVLFLQKLENSKGIKKYMDKRGRTNENKFTFIPTNKNIEIAKEEMKKEKNRDFLTEKKNEIKDDKIKSEKLKFNIESSPYTSVEITERKIDNTNNYLIKTFASFSQNDQTLIKSANFNDYFIEKTKKENVYLSIPDLQKVLSVSPSIQKHIINNIEDFSDLFLKYSKIYDKLEYCRMTISSFIQFLKDSNILLVIPEEKKNIYRRLSNKIIGRNSNIAELKKFNTSLKYSVSCTNLYFTKEEKKYRKNVSKIVNTNNIQNKINLGEASLIFLSLTNYNNFPSNLNRIRTQFDKNTGYKNINISSYMQKTFSFDNKRENFMKKTIPNKMNIILFIKSFELIAAKLYPEMSLDDAFNNLLNRKIFPFIKGRKIDIIDSEEIKEALAKMNNDKIKNLLFQLGNIIHPLYALFSDLSGNMKFYQFFDFYKYFGLFPELISLTQMKAIFFSLCESSSANLENCNTKSNLKKIEQIEFSLFLESLGIASMFFNFKDIVSDIDRLLYICYIIWKSDGIKKQKIEENIPQKINRNFIELFKKYNREDINKYNKLYLTNRKDNNNKTSSSNPNFYRNKLIMIYNKNNDEYNCEPAKRGVYKFDDIY